MFDDLVEANRRYQGAFRDTGVSGRAAKGLAVLTCIDSRIDPLAMLGLRTGDAKIIRNAGARTTEDVLRSLILAVNLLGVTRVAVVHHTDCAVIGSTNEQLVLNVEKARGQAVGDWDFLASPDADMALREDLATIRSCSLLPADLAVAGFLLDVHTGALSLLGDGGEDGDRRFRRG